MGYVIYIALGVLFQYGVYGEPDSILNVWFILHVALWWLFGIYLMLVWMLWPTLILIAAVALYAGAKRINLI